MLFLGEIRSYQSLELIILFCDTIIISSDNPIRMQSMFEAADGHF
jgi:hypothetical protein